MSDLDDLYEKVKPRKPKKRRSLWLTLGPLVAAIVVLASAFVVVSNDSKDVTTANSTSSSTSTTRPTVPEVSFGGVTPMVSPKDIADCPTWSAWDIFLHCMELKDPKLLADFDTTKVESGLSLDDVKRWAEKFPGKEARTIFVYPSASNWSPERIREAAAVDGKVSVESIKDLKIVKVTDFPDDWQTIINTMKLEEHIYSPFVDTRTDVDQVRISLTPLDDEGNVKIEEPFPGVFVSCGNKHWQQKQTKVSTSNAPVGSSTTITSTSTQRTTTSTSTSLTTITTTTQPTCIIVEICVTTRTTTPTTTTWTTTTTTLICLPGEIEVNGRCKDYGNGVGSELPSTLQPTQLPTSTEMAEPDHPTEASPTQTTHAPEPSTTVVVPKPEEGGPTQPTTTSAPPPVQTEATTTAVQDHSGL